MRLIFLDISNHSTPQTPKYRPSWWKCRWIHSRQVLHGRSCWLVTEEERANPDFSAYFIITDYFNTGLP